jgi:sucrose-6-phosphate hydrolase SacC (GH32 family)
VQAGELLFPNSDFESGSLAPWERRGEAFEYQPTQGDNSLARGRETSAHQGTYWIGGFEKRTATLGLPGEVFGDEATGELVSPEFTITKRFITFLVGGGRLPGEVGVRLVCDGRQIDLATGGDAETMSPVSYDVSKFIGMKARLVVYDEARGVWGHVNVDSFAAADEPVRDASNEFALAKEVPSTACEHAAYDQPLRPQFHFSACRGWLNDPNGMVDDGSSYHLFFQHNPLAPVWGNMTWGHATSPDMVHWTQRDHALRPYRVDRRAGTIYSGTAVVDHNNSLGVQRGEQKTLCAFFTFATHPRFYQAMAYSTDGGTSWTYWNEGRPVLENQGYDPEQRDPKVFWHEPSGRWIMVLWLQQNPGLVRFFSSKDLVHWEHASDLSRDWAFECMDLAFLPVDGDKTRSKAVLYDASFDYEIGSFDGREFRTEHGPFLAGGGNFYAAQTFNQSRDGRVVQIGWMRGGPNAAAKYGLPFNQQMSFPCELSLRSVGAEPRLFAWPIAEISELVTDSARRESIVLRDGDNLLAGLAPLDLVDLEIEFDPGSAASVQFDLCGASLTYDARARRLVQRSVDEEGLSKETTVFEDFAPRHGSVKLRLLIDRLSVESYAFDGERFFAAYYAPRSDEAPDAIRSVGGEARVQTLEIRRLRSAWADER